MLGLSFQEMLVIAFVALVALGPEQLPGAMRRFGKFMREVNRALADARDAIEREGEPGDAEGGTAAGGDRDRLRARYDRRLDPPDPPPAPPPDPPGTDPAVLAAPAPLHIDPYAGAEAPPDPPPDPPAPDPPPQEMPPP